jgi:hypothetical protein
MQSVNYVHEACIAYISNIVTEKWTNNLQVAACEHVW